MIGWIDASRGLPVFRIWSLTSIERLIRQLRDVGCTKVAVFGLKDTQRIPSYPGVQIVLGKAEDTSIQKALDDDHQILAVRAEMAYDTRILAKLKTHPSQQVIFCNETNEAVAAVFSSGSLVAIDNWTHWQQPNATRLTSKDIPGYVASLRITVVPEAIALSNRVYARRAEKLFFQSAIKGVMDILYTYVYLRIVAMLMRINSLIPLSPNQVTIGYLFIAAWATQAYAERSWGFALLLSALTMICDAWDGVLARLTFQSSKIGHWLDKISHSVYHPLWYFAIAYSISDGDISSLPFYNAMVLAFLFFIMKPITILYNRKFGRSIYDNTHFDRKFRLITGTRWNMNMICLAIGYLFDKFIEAFYFITIYGAISVVYWLIRYAKANSRKLQY